MAENEKENVADATKQDDGHTKNVAKNSKKLSLLDIMVKDYTLFLIILIIIFVSLLVINPKIADAHLWKFIQESTSHFLEIFKNIEYPD